MFHENTMRNYNVLGWQFQIAIFLSKYIFRKIFLF